MEQNALAGEANLTASRTTKAKEKILIFWGFIQDTKLIGKKVALYARTSTIEQATGLESQVRVLRQYCEQNGIGNFELYTDGGISGTKASRPALDQMMLAVENDEISSVVVHSFSRFARSTTHLLNALTRFKEKGVHFVSISERIDTLQEASVFVFT